MTLLALATKIQELSPTRLNDAAAVLMAKGLLADFLIQARPSRNDNTIVVEVPRLVDDSSYQRGV